MKTQIRVPLLAALLVALTLVCGLSAYAQTTDFPANVNLTSDTYSYQILNRPVLRVSQSGVQGTNLFVGPNAGKNTASTGDPNTFVGSFAGLLNVSGSGNAYFGYQAGYNSLSDQNTFIGFKAGITNTTGFQNTYVGYRAGGASGTPGQTGYANSFMGFDAGYNNTTGQQNAFFGAAAGFSNTTGSGNTFVGYNAGQRNTTGNNNIYVGVQGPATIESGTIRIGGSTQTAAYVGGVYGVSISSGKLVCIDSTGKLGTSCTIGLGVLEDLIRSQAQRIEDLEVRLSQLESHVAK
jgi:hypothetical protein